jgi:hypothetical protein
MNFEDLLLEKAEDEEIFYDFDVDEYKQNILDMCKKINKKQKILLVKMVIPYNDRKIISETYDGLYINLDGLPIDAIAKIHSFLASLKLTN